MTRRSAAARYARALLDVAIQEADPAAVERELDAFATLLQDHPTLKHALENPAVPAARKRALLAEVLRRVTGVSAVTRKLLLLLAERDRIPLLPDLVVTYRERVLDHLQILRADVVTATPVPPDRLQALERSLSEATRKRVQVTTRVDPSIIGGAVARVGSLVLDGSVAGHLARLRDRLTDAG